MDEIQIEEVVERDATPRSFVDVYQDRFGPLVRLATLLTGRVDMAHDVVQDAFVQLHVKWPTVDNPVAYVHRSVVNGCRSHHRYEGRRKGRPAPGEPSTTLAVDHTLATLSTLTSSQHAVIVLKFYEGRTEREIAALTGMRPGSVGPTVQRALERLKEVQS